MNQAMRKHKKTTLGNALSYSTHHLTDLLGLLSAEADRGDPC